MKKLHYLFPICLALTFCKQKDESTTIQQVDTEIHIQEQMADSVRRQQDIAIKKAEAIVSKINKSPKVAKLLPSASSLSSTGKITKVEGKVIQDSSTYDSTRAVLIQKEKDCDSCAKVVTDLQQTIQAERQIRDGLEASLNKKSDILNDSISSMTKQHKKDVRKAQWKGIKKGVVGVLLVIIAIFTFDKVSNL